MPPMVVTATRGEILLGEAASVLADDLDFTRTLGRVAGLFVPEFADWVGVDVMAPDGTLEQYTSQHPDPAREAFLLELRRRYRREKEGREGVLAVMRSGEPVLAPDVRDQVELALREDEKDIYARLDPQSYMIVPLRARGRIVGALTFLSLTAGRHYGEEDLALAGQLASRCAVAVDNARLFRQAEETIGLLDALFATAPVGLALLDLDLRFVRVNDQLAAITRRDARGHLGRRPSEVTDTGAVRETLMRSVLDTGEPVLEREMPGFDETETWSLSCTPVPGRDGEPVGLLETVIDVTERNAMLARERTARARTELLAQAAEVLDRSLDQEATLRNVASVAVPGFAQWCVVYLGDEPDQLRVVALAHADPEREDWAWALNDRYPPDPDAPSGAAHVIRTGRPELVPELPPGTLEAAAKDEEHLRLIETLGITGGMTVPLSARGRVLGAMSLIATRDTPGRYDETDLALAVELGRRAGLALDNARLYTARAGIAHALQARLLPRQLPSIPGVDLAARYRASGQFNEVGGDFYDAFRCPTGEWIVCVGDVTGKGPEAASVTALARYSLRTAALRDLAPSDLLRTVNEAMMLEPETREHCTACVARLALDDGHIRGRLCLAGHEPALVLRATGRVETLGTYGSPLGVVPDPALEDVEVDLGPGDTLLLYTDGVTDAGAPERPLGHDGLVALLEGLRDEDPVALVRAVEQAAVHVQEGEPRDDVALLALRPSEKRMSHSSAGTPTAMTEEVAALEVPGGPEAPSVAREELLRRLAGRVPRRVLDDAGLLVSELVTNSILHGRVGADGVLGLRLALRGERVRVEVSDAGPGFDPKVSQSGPDEPGGYGLFLVTQLADAWGISPD